MAQCWERSSPANVSKVRFWPGVTCGLSSLLFLTLLWGFFTCSPSSTKTNIYKFQFHQDRGPTWRSPDVTCSLNIAICCYFLFFRYNDACTSLQVNKSAKSCGLQMCWSADRSKSLFDWKSATRKIQWHCKLKYVAECFHSRGQQWYTETYWNKKKCLRMKRVNSHRAQHGAGHEDGDEDDTSKYGRNSLNSCRFVLIIFPISDYYKLSFPPPVNETPFQHWTWQIKTRIKEKSHRWES